MVVTRLKEWSMITAVVLLSCLTVVCLLCESSEIDGSGVIGRGLIFGKDLLLSPKTQGLTYTCLLTQFAIFWAVEQRLTGRRFWKLNSTGVLPSLAIVCATVSYCSAYPLSASPPRALVFLSGLVLGRFVAVLKVSQGSASVMRSSWPWVGAFVALLLYFSLFGEGKRTQTFLYAGQARWSNPWGNPNTYGILMGSGAVLVAGSALGMLGNRSLGLFGAFMRSSTSMRFVVGGLCFVAALMLRGVYHSYSRGAWAGTAIALTYLTIVGRDSFQSVARTATAFLSPLQDDGLDVPTGVKSVDSVTESNLCSSWRSESSLLLAGIVILVALALLPYGQSPLAALRRVRSLVDRNDFSWRNRLSAFESALQMMADRPWFGFGWNQPARIYDKYYRLPKVDEWMAIETNDFAILGTSAGMPALGFLLVYLGRTCFQTRSINEDSSCRPGGSLVVLPSSYRTRRVGFRAGAIVLLVGFCLDGGLFKIATAAPFWVLLELGTASILEDTESLTGLKRGPTMDNWRSAKSWLEDKQPGKGKRKPT
jgi:hypothetical protein